MVCRRFRRACKARFEAYEREGVRQRMLPAGAGNFRLPGFEPGVNIAVGKNQQAGVPRIHLKGNGHKHGHIPQKRKRAGVFSRAGPRPPFQCRADRGGLGFRIECLHRPRQRAVKRGEDLLFQRPDSGRKPLCFSRIIHSVTSVNQFCKGDLIFETADCFGYPRVLYHGPRNDLPDGYAPKEVIPMLNARKNDILCIRGNCDTEVDQMVLDFPLMADYALLCVDNLRIYATHGHVFNPDRLPPLQPGDILLYGHTHIPAWDKKDGVLCLNPGSVSIPKANSARGYMVLEDGVFSWKTLSGDEYHSVNA